MSCWFLEEGKNECNEILSSSLYLPCFSMDYFSLWNGISNMFNMFPVQRQWWWRWWWWPDLHSTHHILHILHRDSFFYLCMDCKQVYCSTMVHQEEWRWWWHSMVASLLYFLPVLPAQIMHFSWVLRYNRIIHKSSKSQTSQWTPHRKLEMVSHVCRVVVHLYLCLYSLSTYPSPTHTQVFFPSASSLQHDSWRYSLFSVIFLPS